jgi:hypothetical protein
MLTVYCTGLELLSYGVKKGNFKVSENLLRNLT